MNSFADKIRRIRESKDMTYEEFGKYVNVSDTSIYAYETGKRLPTAYVVKSICEKCGVSADYLLDVTIKAEEKVKYIVTKDGYKFSEFTEKEKAKLFVTMCRLLWNNKFAIYEVGYEQ